MNTLFIIQNTGKLRSVNGKKKIVSKKISLRNYNRNNVVLNDDNKWDFFFSGSGKGSGTLGEKLGKIDWEKLKLKNIVKNIYDEDQEVANMPKEKVKEFSEEHGISFIGKKVPPNPILSFENLNINRRALSRLKKQFKAPTYIQSFTWPSIMNGENLVGSAETGSGKTLAFLVPIFEHVVAQTDTQAWPKALVIAPTRELVRQIHETSLEFARDYQVHSLYAHGGSQNRSRQENDIRNLRPEVIIASPGRIIDFVENGLITLENVSMLVLDEADLLLQMGFEDQLKMILSQVRPDKQALMFSATWPSAVQHLAKKYFGEYVHLNVGSLDLTANPRVAQHFRFLRSYKERLSEMINIANTVEGKILIFTSTKSSCETIKQDLAQAGIGGIGSLHGDHSQSQRERELNQFHTGSNRILISTDLASRGIDVKDIKAVINFELPKTISPYIHRIGRTARAGTKGDSYSFVSPADFDVIPDLVRVIKEAGQVVPPELEAALKRSPQMQGRNTGKSFSTGRFRNERFNNDSYGNRGDRSDKGDKGDRFERRDRIDRTDRVNRSDRVSSTDRQGSSRTPEKRLDLSRLFKD
jgi:ATP-dependent RNA helicase DDX5/DBP2